MSALINKQQCDEYFIHMIRNDEEKKEEKKHISHLTSTHKMEKLITIKK